MKSWLLRGLVFTALMVLVRVVQGWLINKWETHTILMSVLLVTAYAVVALLWGLLDGRADAAAEPDPDRRADLAMTWLLAGLLAGVLSGFLAWLIKQLYENIYVEGLPNELTTFASFTALITFVSAIIGVSVGRWFTDRAAARRGVVVGRHRTDDAPDTDVFAAVSADATQPHRIPQPEGGSEGQTAR